ncbi:Mitochondrial distribution and morphology protein 10 AltName: Full=Mitochondrial inheritance component MDM10 [Rhizoctonia solani AG-1 IB]|uniref:Mitochondrial distribution and morphology protein 10 n=1 Tax=Thanatephorus cucumeris (strain AG1-IB / isolate 7/3/14) TaxID=1108050 RepID=M5BLE9_THACB|nr:Mitochondrial distribution and morphology protein 10 AltName: Full=Mitochondrial inheritance component MDM10 [Rhizoctonia solani AG-1 IB]
MHPFASYVLRCYNQATGWNDDNLYSNLTKSSRAILDFTVPRGVHFSISKSANALFNTSYAMNALPTLNGSIGYIFTSCDLELKQSATVPFKDVVDRFVIHDRPRRPIGKEELFLGGRNINAKEYLLYGRYYVPSSRLDALYSVRLSPTLQGLIAAVSNSRARFSPHSPSSPSRESAGNVMFSLQHDIGRWCTEYSWSADDGMWGVRVLHNFGRLANEAIDAERVARKERERGTKRVDEEERMEGGLKGRLSAGAELYFSLKEKSAGVSTGIRFTTLPDASPPSISGSPELNVPAQTPTTLTATFNPMMGHMSAAYESEWTMGAEWWLRRSARRRFAADSQKEEAEKDKLDSEPVVLDDISPPGQDTPSPFPPAGIPALGGDVTGVVKARISTSSDVSLMWEGRIRNMLVSLGVVSDLSNRSKPIKSIGLELAYFSGPE